MKEEQLIFIISQPRSGSTYLQNLLSNNSFVNTVSEPWLLLNFVSIIKPDLYKTVFDEGLTHQALQEYTKNLPDKYFSETFKDFVLKLYKPLTKEHLYFLDKTPRYWEIADELVTLFPNAKVIVLLRNPIDVVNSMIRTWDLNTLKSLSQFKRDLLIAPYKLYNFVKKNKLNDNVRAIRYEDLTTNKKEEIFALYEWLQIPYNDEILNTESNYKFKGGFGDPFQNSKNDNINERSKANKKPIDRKHREFSQGYAHYLNEEFLNEFGYINNLPKRKKTMAFRYFVSIKSTKYISQNQSLKRKILRNILRIFYS